MEDFFGNEVRPRSASPEDGATFGVRGNWRAVGVLLDDNDDDTTGVAFWLFLDDEKPAVCRDSRAVYGRPVTRHNIFLPGAVLAAKSRFSALEFL
jgi:hypothetical protein